MWRHYFFMSWKKKEHIFVTLVEGVWDKMKKFGEKKWLKVNWEGLYMFSNIKMMVAHKTLMMMLAFTYSKLFGEQMWERSTYEMHVFSSKCYPYL